MRTMFVGTFVLLMTGLCVAQADRPTVIAPTTQPTLTIQPPAQQRAFRVDPLPLVTNEALKQETARNSIEFRFAPRPKLPPAYQDHCYSMRTYLFSEGNGTAPKRKGYTTCVPSSKLQLRLAKPETAPAK